jgi:hypothetical protein
MANTNKSRATKSATIGGGADEVMLGIIARRMGVALAK